MSPATAIADFVLQRMTSSARTGKEPAVSMKGVAAIWELRVYVAGQTPKSLAALSNLQRICDEHLQARYELEIVDLLQKPEMAALEQIIAIPTVLRSRPLPRKKIAGDLSNTEEVLLSLEIPAQSGEAEDVLRAISSGEVDAFVQQHESAGEIVALQGTEEPYRLLLESMNEGALTLAHDGTILYCNSRFAEIVSARSEELVGCSFQRYIGNEQQERFSTLLGEGAGGSSRGEFTLRAGQTGNIPVQLSFHVVRCAGVPAVSLLVSDISELKRAEDALEQSRREQMRIKDEFLSHVSHELRSPLTAIYQFVSILNDEIAGPLNSDQKEFVQITGRNVRQLHAMIDDLLEITRAETGKLTVEPQWTCIRAAIEEVVNSSAPSAAEKEILLKAELPASLPLVYADPARVRQILTNLVQNAIKFTPAHGHITARAKAGEEHKGFLLLEVEDTGCGLQPEAVEKIFERLYQIATPTEAGRKGLGIGLYICKELVKRQGGKIWVNSEPGRGSCFCFTLPTASLSTLIAPLMPKLRSSSYSAALFTVTASCEAVGAKTSPPEGLCHEVRQVVQRCTLPDLDVLLPKTGGAHKAGRCLIFAVTKPDGAPVLANRLREQLQRWEQNQRTGLVFSVDYTFLELPPSLADADNEELLKVVTHNLEALARLGSSAAEG
ncbi:MAG TPA: ATP-binding protein [Terriglobales bacterium]|nr:ATP-binding protein [Terriglobales bacterium]